MEETGTVEPYTPGTNQTTPALYTMDSGYLGGLTMLICRISNHGSSDRLQGQILSLTRTRKIRATTPSSSLLILHLITAANIVPLKLDGIFVCQSHTTKMDMACICRLMCYQRPRSCLRPWLSCLELSNSIHWCLFHPEVLAYCLYVFACPFEMLFGPGLFRIYFCSPLAIPMCCIALGTGVPGPNT